MWCKNCKQDVPGVRGESFESIRCARCQQELASARASKSRISQTPSSISFAEWQHGNLPDSMESSTEPGRGGRREEAAKNDDLPRAEVPRPALVPEKIELDQLQEYDAEIRRIDRIIHLWGEPRYLRFDSAHNGPHAKTAKEKEKVSAVQRTAAVDDQKTVRPNSMAFCLTFGGLLAIGLGVAHTITSGEPELARDARIAAGFISAGGLGIIAGLWYEIGRLKRKLNQIVGDISEDGV